MAGDKQTDDAKKQHKEFASGKATCIDCHTGVAHKEHEEPKAPTATPAAAPADAAASK